MTKLINSELFPNERIIWQGKPDRKSFPFMGPSLFIIPFTVVWLGVALFIEITALTDGAPVPFLRFGALFVALGVYIAIGRFFVASKQYDQLQNALTDKRALIQRGISNIEFQSVDLRKVSEIELHLKSSGKGDIIFGLKGMLELRNSVGRFPSIWKRPFHIDLRNYHEDAFHSDHRSGLIATDLAAGM